MRNALFGIVLLVAACDVTPVIRSVTKLGDTYDQVGPYVVLAEVSDPDGLDLVRLFYQPGSATTVELEMSEVSEGVFSGAIPGQAAGTRVKYFVLVDDADASVAEPPEALGPARARLSFDVLREACTTSLDCDPGEFCDHAGNCLLKSGPCKKDSDCGKGFRCDVGGSCRMAARSCQLDEGCLIGEVCDKILGECIPRPSCDQSQTCPLDFSCNTSLGVCLRACMGASDCGPGEGCNGGVCSGATACQKTAECSAGLACDPLLKVCRPEGAGLCAACARDADCGGPTDFCILFSSGQYCGRDCTAKPCPSGYTCNSNTTPAQCTPQTGSCK